MEKVIVVYKSKSGYTEKYAKWIAEELDCSLSEAKNVKLSDLMQYDTIIYGGGLYATGINGIKLITSSLDSLESKNIIVFTLGASPIREETKEELKNKNFTKSQQERIDFYMLRGGFDFKKLKPFDKLLMLILKAKLKAKKERNADERGMLASYDHPADFTDKRRIQPIIEAVKNKKG